ncbi:MAG TPA: Hpt domain-containing protein, partial [Steroidobacteraceae bacterium]|nr:Hpt domain-containing protein [Steroidobacteraceae bacterium]
EEVYRACHTLSGSSKMAQARHGIRLAEPLDHWLRRAFSSGVGLGTEDLALLEDCMVAMETVATHLDEPTGFFVNHWQLLERIERADRNLEQRIAAAATHVAGAHVATAAAAVATGAEPADEAVDFDPEVAAIFTDEATELIDASEHALSDWRSQPASAEYRLGLKRPLHTLKGGARMAGITPMGDLSHEVESLVMLVDTGKLSADGALFDAIQASLDELARMRDRVATGQPVAPARAVITRLQALARPAGAPPAAPAAPARPAATPAPPAVTSAAPAAAARPAATSAAPAAVATPAAATAVPMTRVPIPPRTAVPVPPALPVTAAAPGPTTAPVPPMPAPQAGSGAGSRERFVLPVASAKAAPALETSESLDGTDTALAKLNAELLESRGDEEAAPPAARELARAPAASPSATPPAPRAAAAEAPQAVPAPPAPVPPAAAEAAWTSASALAAVSPLSRARGVEGHAEEGLAPPQPVPPGREPVAATERQEMARVDAELLDQLLNISGEASIARARLEQQLGSFDFNLGELSRTVTRLKEQLRHLEIETETQILHKHEDEGPHRSEFDPLELDRYSSIQQYSRALAETANDVASIQQLLENLAKDTQNLLQQQARTITELQNGLMRTRMVPFQRHVQRLARIVRQAAADTGKRAELIVEGASGELDRQVLERMLPPFEHM